MPTESRDRVVPEGRLADIVGKTELALAIVTIVLAVGVAASKVPLAWRLNVNWDEFYFLNHVYALTRGELTFVLQGAYTHAFAWLTHVPGQEVDQVVAGRLVMTAFLALTAWLVWRLARLWMHGLAAALPPFVFLTFLPVLEHGGSFRADSLLAPLSVAALLLLLSPARSSRRDWAAGAMLGIAFAVTIKVVLFGPLVFFAIVFRESSASGLRVQWAAAASTMARVGVVAALVAAALLGLHALSLGPGEPVPVTTYAARSASMALVETPWFPRLAYLLRYFDWQPLPWILIGCGAGLALARRRFDVAVLSLALLPLVFYRNAFPYYFVVMLAPATVLAGWAFAEFVAIVRRQASVWTTTGLIAVLWSGTVFNGLRYFDRLVLDDQSLQREVIAGIHRIFPEPVSYIDRCGMVSSFRKANSFMSTWGISRYRQRNTAVMPATFVTKQPAFVLVNTPVLNPGYAGEAGLLAEDQELLGERYVEYWGPVRVAGADFTLQGSIALRAHVPFAGSYRVVTDQPVLIERHVRMNGDIVEVASAGAEIALAGDSPPEGVRVRLIIASAQPPPNREPPPFALFRNL